jgi:purine-binding chemotaxis protein CheW
MDNIALENEINNELENATEEKKNLPEALLQDQQKKESFIRMVTFALGGKDYAIDIMKVKEIAKAAKFTYVPNAPHYVRGVYNLRGLIISIIDIRKLFNLQIADKKETEAENIIILKIADMILGVIVDRINKVVNIEADAIKAPPPLLKEANLKYMSGVMEYQNNLHIILDVDKMFADKEEVLNQAKLQKDETGIKESPKGPDTDSMNGKEEELNFVIETLATFKNFHLTPINKEWVFKRFGEWQMMRKVQGLSTQLSGEEDADAFLETFYSPCSGRFWNDEYIGEFKTILPNISTNSIRLWNAGCGKGHETYALACTLRERYNKEQIKIWAVDSSLLNITVAPNLVLKDTEIIKRFIDMDFIKKTPTGYQFTNNITDLIIFEYHNLLNKNAYPELDMIVARDILSFFKPNDQLRLLEEFGENLKEDGILIIGQNERIDHSAWLSLTEGNILAYRKKKN